jgi:hypothetical protein
MAAARTGCSGYLTFLRWPPFADDQRSHERAKGCEVAGSLTMPTNRRQRVPDSLNRELGPAANRGWAWAAGQSAAEQRAERTPELVVRSGLKGPRTWCESWCKSYLSGKL